MEHFLIMLFRGKFFLPFRAHNQKILVVKWLVALNARYLAVINIINIIKLKQQQQKLQPLEPNSRSLINPPEIE